VRNFFADIKFWPCSVLIVGVWLRLLGSTESLSNTGELRAEWLPALKDGLIAAERRDLSDAVRDDDLRISFFGSLFRPHGAMGAEFPPFNAADLTSDQEVALLSELYDQAVAQQPELGPPTGALGPIRVGVQVMAQRLLRSRTFAQLAERPPYGYRSLQCMRPNCERRKCRRDDRRRRRHRIVQAKRETTNLCGVLSWSHNGGHLRLAEVRLNTGVSGDRAPGGKARTCTRFQVLVDRRAQKSWASS
jgi:hypothetical protein